jgi:Xaa-Pro dipeptidase
MYRLTPKRRQAKWPGERLVRRGERRSSSKRRPVYFTGSIQQESHGSQAGSRSTSSQGLRAGGRGVGVEIIEKIASPKEIPAWFEKKGVSFRSLGFEMDVMPVSIFHRYAGLFPGSKTEDISTIVRELRSVKGPSEIEAMRTCGKKLSALLSGARKEIRAGMTETVCGVRRSQEVIRPSRGCAPGTRKWAWAVSGPDAAVPSYADVPTAGKGTCPFVPSGQGYRAFGKNEPIIVDTIGAQDGYLVDLARTYVIGKLPEKLTMAHELSVKILRNLESAIRPGAVAGDLYEVGMEMASRSPFAACFMGPPGYNVKFIGHGIGIEADEFPFIAKGAKTVLAPGMTFALEPKFVFPGEGAVGLENVYLVTETGFEKLTYMEEEIISCPANGGD